MSQSVTIRANDFTLRDFFVDHLLSGLSRCTSKITTPRSYRKQFFPTNMIEVHNLSGKLNATINTRTISCLANKSIDLRALLTIPLFRLLVVSSSPLSSVTSNLIFVLFGPTFVRRFLGIRCGHTTNSNVALCYNVAERYIIEQETQNA